MNLNAAISGAVTGGSAFGPWGAVAGGLAGGLLGGEDTSQDQLAEIMKRTQGIPLPELQKMIAEQYSSVGSVNPELESIINLGPSAMEGISTDPALRQAQMNALLKLQGISDAGGKDAEFLAGANRVQNQVNANLKGNQDAIQQNLAARGLSGGLSEQVQRQMAAQSAANQQASMGLDLNAQAQQRALSALMSGAQLGGQMEQNQFNQKSQIAQAQDAINKFNIANQQQISGQNIDRRNNAQIANLQNQQNIANMNTGARQAANEYNLNLPQQNFNNQMSRVGMTNTAQQNMAKNSARQAQQQNQFLGDTFTSIAKTYGDKKDEK